MESDSSSVKKKGEKSREQRIFRDIARRSGTRGYPIYVDDSPTVLISNPGEAVKTKQLPTAPNEKPESKEVPLSVGEQNDTIVDPPEKQEEEVKEEMPPAKRSKVLESRRLGRKMSLKMFSSIRDLSGQYNSLYNRSKAHLDCISDVLQSRDQLDAERAMQLILLLVQSWLLSVQLTEGSGSEEEAWDAFSSSMKWLGKYSSI